MADRLIGKVRSTGAIGVTGLERDCGEAGYIFAYRSAGSGAL
jgi:hypothetical protein